MNISIFWIDFHVAGTAPLRVEISIIRAKLFNLLVPDTNLSTYWCLTSTYWYGSLVAWSRVSEAVPAEFEKVYFQDKDSNVIDFFLSVCFRNAALAGKS